MSDEAGRDQQPAVQRTGSFWQTVSAVAWSFFGVRRGVDHERDIARLNPVHVVIAGLVGVAVFVLSLVLLIQWVIGSGVAGS